MKNLLTCAVLGLLAMTPPISSSAAEVSAALTIDVAHPGVKIPDDYAGLSFETKREMPDATGGRYFRPDNAPLIRMIQMLGVKTLRIGGNTVDNLKVPIPAQADIDSLFKFAQAAGLKVIYSFRLRVGDPAGSAVQAKYIADNYGANLYCFAIGNEANVYVHTYPEYVKMWQPVYDAINQAVPTAKYGGPSLTNHGDWAAQFAAQFGPGGRIRYLTQHGYPGGPAGKVPSPALGRDEMLSPEWPAQIYQEYYDRVIAPMKSSGLPYRLEETNSFYNGGAKDVSDSFASALWGLDYLYWWAAHGLEGLNFHNGDEVAVGQSLTPCRYASFTTTPDGYFAHPLAYGIKVFDLGSHGWLVPSGIASGDSAKDLNLVGYAVLGADKNLYVTLINKEHGPAGRDAHVTIDAGSYTNGWTMALLIPNNDPAAEDGMTLGGHSIENNGSWKEAWTKLPAAAAGGKVKVKVPACSVLLVRLTGA